MSRVVVEKDGARSVDHEPAPTDDSVDPVVLERVVSLAASMRAVGAGRARLGDLELDLTVPPAPVLALEDDRPIDNEMATLQRQREAEGANERRENVLFRAAGGRRARLPLM